jgi:hypothetical protein
MFSLYFYSYTILSDSLSFRHQMVKIHFNIKLLFNLRLGS